MKVRVSDKGVEDTPKAAEEEFAQEVEQDVQQEEVDVQQEVEQEEVEILEVKKTPKSKRKFSAKRVQPQRSGKKSKVDDQQEQASENVPETEEKASKSSTPQKSTLPQKLIEELECKEEFFVTQKLENVWELLKFQKWEHLFEKEESVNMEAVFEFYRTVKKFERGAFVYLEFDYKGQELIISSWDLANILKLDHEGFDIFAKGALPESVSEETWAEMQERVCGLSSPEKNDITTQFMTPTTKILHKLLVTTILPRGSKPSLAQIQDILVLDQLMQKRKINLPKLIIHQLDYVSKLSNVGHARIVKKILEFHKVYDNSSDEVSVVKAFDTGLLRRMGLIFTDEDGWIKQRVEPVSVEEPVVNEQQTDDDEIPPAKIEKLEKDISDIKKGVDQIRDGLWVIEDDFNSFKKTVEEGFKGLQRVVEGAVAEMKAQAGTAGQRT